MVYDSSYGKQTYSKMVNHIKKTVKFFIKILKMNQEEDSFPLITAQNEKNKEPWFWYHYILLFLTALLLNNSIASFFFLSSVRKFVSQISIPAIR